MNRRTFLGAAAAGATGWAQQPKRPNIVLIVADDLGYNGVGVHGMKDIPTPHIDSIARAGVRFTNGYVSCPVCSPTRAGLMTGRYQQRFGHEFNPGPALRAESNFGLPLTETTLADRLKKQGYATGMFGKWHLGYAPDKHPMKRGFDEFFGHLGGAHDYLDQADKANMVMRGTTPVEKITYLTDVLGDEAVSFIERRRKETFFMYLPFNAVHAPMQATDKYTSRFASISDERRRTHAGMMAAMDDQIGRVLAKLREAKLEENTLLFFVSDNGGPTLQTTSSNLPLRGYKGQVLEGGIRVPFMVQWKGRIPAGKTYDQPVIALDIHPTAVVAAGGASPSGLDGVDLLPYITGKKSGAPHDALYWRTGPRSAIRMGDWKMLRQDGGAELYNLRADIGEAQNLAEKEPEQLKKLEAAWSAWNAQLAAPLWQPVDRRGGAKGGGKKKKR